jgi:hypothetical protein
VQVQCDFVDNHADFVQWKFKNDKKSKTFLVIFHFVDDFSKQNLRMKEHILQPEGLSVMTWAPSHVEIALFGGLLFYANIINGLSETAKASLVLELQGYTSIRNLPVQMKEKLTNLLKEKGFDMDEVTEGTFLHPLYVKEEGRRKRALWLINRITKKIYFCPMLTQGYINYIKELLKPYI